MRGLENKLGLRWRSHHLFPKRERRRIREGTGGEKGEGGSPDGRPGKIEILTLFLKLTIPVSAPLPLGGGGWR